MSTNTGTESFHYYGDGSRREFIKSVSLPGLFFLVPSKTDNHMNPQGIVTQPSKYSVKETIGRLETFLKEHGATIYARIDQQAELEKAGQTMAPLEFLLFGNPKAGGPVMLQNPLAALDLPLKVIAWEDKDKKVWVAYNEASYIQGRYSLPDQVSAVLNLDPVIRKVIG